jgi:hypothetical protein
MADTTDKTEFCRNCGANIPPREGEGTCPKCDPSTQICAFINAPNDNPEKIDDWEGFFVKQNGCELELYGARTFYYWHPDAPGEAYITVLRNRLIKKVKESDREYAAIYMFFQSQKVIQQLGITNNERRIPKSKWKND